MVVDPKTVSPAQLRAARAFMGWSQSDLARMAHVDVVAVMKAEEHRMDFPPAPELIVVTFISAGIVFDRDGIRPMGDDD